jgi:hypothetical protein
MKCAFYRIGQVIVRFRGFAFLKFIKVEGYHENQKNRQEFNT